MLSMQPIQLPFIFIVYIFFPPTHYEYSQSAHTSTRKGIVLI